MTERRRLLGNSLSLLANRLAQSITAFVLVAAIARILGPYQLGQYMLAFSFYYVFMTLSSQGLKTLFTRELAVNPSETPVYLVSGTFLQFIFSIIGYVGLIVLVFVLPYKPDTAIVCYVMGLAIIPFSLSNITEAIFQAQEKMHLIAISTVPVYILRVLIILWAMNLKYDITTVSAIMVVSEALILLLEWGLIVRLVKPKWKIDWNFIWCTTKASRTFLAIEGMAILKDRMQVLILSLLAGEVVVGLFGSITQLMQPFQIISYSLVIAVFPKMSKAVNLGQEKQRKLTESIVEALLIVALPFIVGLFFIGRELLVLMYRDPVFADAAFALNIVSLGLISTAFGRPLSYALVANGFERINLIEVSINTVIGGLVSVAMVSLYQLNGAAIALVFLQFFATAIYVYFVYKRLFTLRLWHLLRRPVLVSVLMAASFLVCQRFSQNTVVIMLVASAAYGLIVSILGVYVLGGPQTVWNKVFQKK
ncbi:MAG TPA: polysaccharide biosynthesis protein [Cyanobacteria bacterium UBA8553]|nr:polysaccharide biosynthesis protein [Cyanobacteria bacterium UBA8553]HAJ64539.1 polysaccharide biosynthesis protein [Cyanobacteria bacterium UBA8543]